MRNLVHINALINYNEEDIFYKLSEAFINTKEIIDYIKNNI